MTGVGSAVNYPPNQPPQGEPYGQRPLGGAPHGRQQQQQPGYGQPSPPGFGQSGPGQPGSGQQAGYGAARDYDPQPDRPFGATPGGLGQAPGHGPPPQKKSRLPLILGAAGVVVIALAIGAFVVLNSGVDNDPHEVAQTIVDEMNKVENANADKIEGQLCDAQKDAVSQKFTSLIDGFKEVKKQAGDQFSAKFTVVDVKTEGEQGSFGIIAETSFQGQPTKATIPVQLVLEDGSWKACDVQR